MELLEKDILQLFTLFVVPGLISMRIYRIFIPTKEIDWKTSILEGAFYSVVNFIIFIPLIIFIIKYRFYENHPIWFSIFVVFILLVGPLIWPILFIRLLKTKYLKKFTLQLYPTAWDSFFSKRDACFMLIHLKNGKLIGGLYGPGSYATAYPRDGDLYMSAVYSVDYKGNFGIPIPNTKGILITKDAYSYIELFNIQKRKE